jgi:hypothetical protein
MPQMSTLLVDAEWWLKRAEQCRARAVELQDAPTRERMLQIADGYVRIADDLRDRQNDLKNTSQN